MVSNEKDDRVRYTFYHKSIGNVVIAEPIGFNDDDLEYSRHSDYHGVFTLFSNNLEFYGNSRTIIKNIYDVYGINAKLELKKEILEKDTTQINTMLYVEQHTGYLDFPTLKVTKRKATCRFNSSNLATTIKTSEGIAVEIERNTTLDGTSIPVIIPNNIILQEKDILAVDQWILNGTQVFTPDLFARTPLLTLVSHQHVDDPSAVVDDYSAGGLITSGNMFWVQNIATITLDLSITITAIIEYGQADFYVDRFRWDGTSYILVEQIEIGPLVGEMLSKDITVSLDIDDSLALTVRTDIVSSSVTITGITITASETSTFTTTETQRFVYIHELLDKIATIITNKSNVFYSEYFGRTDLGYTTLGKGGETGFTSGYWVRNFNKLAERYKSPTISWKDIVSSLSAVFNIGFGIEKINTKETVIIEDLRYFYQNIVTVTLDSQVSDISREVYDKGFYNEIEIGYSKSGKYEQDMGLDEPNGKTTFSTFITAIKNKYSKLSKVRADSYGKEFARRKPQSLFPTLDTKYDDSNWFLDIKNNITSFTEKLWADRFAIIPTGIFSPETLTNIWFSPVNCLLRHSWWFSQGFEKDLDKYTRFTSATGNSDLKTQLVGGKEFSEDGDILNYYFNRPILLPELIKFTSSVNSSILKQLRGTTNISGREIPNVYGLIEFINEYNQKEQGYLKSLKPNSGEWEIIKANTIVRRAQSLNDIIIAGIEIFDTDIVSVEAIDTNVNNQPFIGVLSFSSKTSTSVSLTWTAANDTNLDGYYVYYKLSTDITWTLFSTETAAVLSKTITGLTSVTSYDFSIIAFDSGSPVLSSLRSNIITEITSDNIAPTSVILSYGAPTDTTIPLTWTAATDNVAVTGYKLLWKLHTSGTWATIDLLSTNLYYTKTGLANSTSYDFKVQAYDGDGNTGADSNIVTNSTLSGGATWYSFSGTSANTTENNACGDHLTDTYYALVSNPNNGDYIYISENTSVPLAGNSYWYKIGSSIYKIDNNGLIIQTSVCGEWISPP